MAERPRDRLGRSLGSLRLSVTDRCNMRCRYCMPEEEYVWLPRSSLLSFEELARVAAVFTRLGVTKVRLTGGEPLLRHDLAALVRLLRQNPAIQDLALTTNGILLEAQAGPLREAGLDRVSVSLDTLRPDRLAAFARSAQHDRILAGIAALARAGFTGTRINSVVVRGYNDDELGDLIEFGRDRNCEIRFIEYMDVGGATRWRASDVVSREEILAALTARYGSITPVGGRGSAPAEQFRLPDGTVFGIIASTTQPFCRDCDRSRVTADGTWFTCLYGAQGIDLRTLLRAGAGDAELEGLVASTWSSRTDRGAELRAAGGSRDVLYQVESLRQDPRREMHTRGG